MNPNDLYGGRGRSLVARTFLGKIEGKTLDEMVEEEWQRMTGTEPNPFDKLYAKEAQAAR